MFEIWRVLCIYIVNFTISYFVGYNYIIDTKEEYDATGKKTYYEICTRLNTTPVSYFVKHMGDNEINLQYHGVGVKGAKAVAGALVVSS